MVIYNFGYIAFIIYDVIEEYSIAFCLIISGHMPGVPANKTTILQPTDTEHDPLNVQIIPLIMSSQHIIMF